MISFQLSPPSVLRKRPLPGPPDDSSPGLPPRLPEGSIDDVRVRRVYRDVHGPGAVVPEKDLSPALSAVGGLVDSTLRVRHGMDPERANPGRVAIGGMDADPGDVLGFFQAQVIPAASRVRAPIDPVALHDIAPELGLSGSDVDDVGVGFADGNRSHRGAGDLPVGHRTPGEPAIGALPEPAAGGAEIVLQGPGGASCHPDGPSAPVGANVLPPEALEELLWYHFLGPKGAGVQEQQGGTDQRHHSQPRQPRHESVGHLRSPRSGQRKTAKDPDRAQRHIKRTGSSVQEILATASISTSTCFGRVLTATAALAGR